MAVKTITITEDAYTKLAALKEPHESFSDVVKRITGKNTLLELKGILSAPEAHALTHSIKELRKAMKKRLERVARELT